MARAFYSLGEHLLRGRLNMSTAQVTGKLVTYPTAITSSGWRQKIWYSEIPSGWVSYQVPAVVVPGVISTDVTEETVRFVVPDMVFLNAGSYAETGYALVFYVDTGDPANSPLLGYDDIGTVSFTENFQYIYKSSSDGLIQITL